jgi:1-aminocyclopropane-1-carboxylate deaminase/D-cysteine desulfhydrase-like pyridoxal-dependent ACC family enzyme
MNWPTKSAEYQEIYHPLFREKEVRVFVLRDDLLHPGISGNKWRKLKYNLLEISKTSIKTLVTVGGSHSNHIAAVAEAGHVFGFRTVGLIRGYEAYRENPTLAKAAQKGMDIRFLNKTEFAQLEADFLPRLHEEMGEFAFIPMGGGNVLGMQGCMEITNDVPVETTHFTVACGTGTTLAGIVAGAKSGQTVLGFPAIKNGEFLQEDILGFLREMDIEPKADFRLITEYHFGGMGKMTPDLIHFIQQFLVDHQIPLDGIYTGKMMFGIFDLLRQEYFPKGSVITAIHTGGLQGNRGLNEKYECQLPL